jgi:hypothetical protein
MPPKIAPQPRHPKPRPRSSTTFEDAADTIRFSSTLEQSKQPHSAGPSLVSAAAHARPEGRGSLPFAVLSFRQEANELARNPPGARRP